MEFQGVERFVKNDGKVNIHGRGKSISYCCKKKSRFAGADPAERRAPMDMENEMLEEGAAGEVVTPETEAGETGQPAEAGGEKESGDAGRSAERQTQTHEERVRYSAARKQGEKTGYDRAVRDINARISRANLFDPITNKPITSLEEFEDYGQRYNKQRIEARAKQENKSVAQVEEEETAMELLRRKRREDGEAAENARKEQERREWLRQDAESFKEIYPEVDLLKLEKDPKFRRFCGNRMGSVPAAELYADYLEVVGNAQQEAAARKQDKQERGTGSGGGAGGEGMTAAQRKELEAWNEANPHLKMSEKDFMRYRS